MPKIIWQPHPGSQTAFLLCKEFECLYHGNRGCGKTDALLFDFLREVGRGYGTAWRGILFRQNYKMLGEVIERAREKIPMIFPDAKYNEQDSFWRFQDGETLLFRHMERESRIYDYQGHQYPWIGWEEITTWPTDTCYVAMKATCRSANKDMPKRIRATTNPWGPGHNWVKQYFRPKTHKMLSAYRDRETGELVASVYGHFDENESLSHDKTYQIHMARGLSPEHYKAWILGSWDITAGGYFDDLWDPQKHILKPFEIPETWTKRRSFDWGSAKPCSLGMWAISDGTPLEPCAGYPGGKVFPRGSIIRFDEWYSVERDEFQRVKPNEGMRLSTTEVGQRIAKLSMGHKWSGCVADPSIFVQDGGPSHYEQMRVAARDMGVPLIFRKADNKRLPGWQRVRQLLESAKEQHPESPGLWVFDNCHQFIRTFPVLQRDQRNPDDVDSNLEDHIADETRYLAMSAIERVTLSDWEPV